MVAIIICNMSIVSFLIFNLDISQDFINSLYSKLVNYFWLIIIKLNIQMGISQVWLNTRHGQALYLLGTFIWIVSFNFTRSPMRFIWQSEPTAWEEDCDIYHQSQTMQFLILNFLLALWLLGNYFPRQVKMSVFATISTNVVGRIMVTLNCPCPKFTEHVNILTLYGKGKLRLPLELKLLIGWPWGRESLRLNSWA